MKCRLFVTSTSSTRSGWFNDQDFSGPSLIATTSPYCRAQSVRNLSRSSRNGLMLPKSQCPLGPGGQFSVVRGAFVVVDMTRRLPEGLLTTTDVACPDGDAADHSIPRRPDHTFGEPTQ